MEDRLLRDKACAARLAISRSHFWRLVQLQKIPQPIKLGKRLSVWRSSDINLIVENPTKYLSTF
jgi:predicted DNA-binding transcriptional regulator AlpA